MLDELYFSVPRDTNLAILLGANIVSTLLLDQRESQSIFFSSGSVSALNNSQYG